MNTLIGKVQKVPTTPAEALNSSLMGFFQKRNFRSFLIFINQYEADKPATFHKGMECISVSFFSLCNP
jgi:Rab GDP dissociation inhibitor